MSSEERAAAASILLENAQAQLPPHTRPKVNKFVLWLRSREWTMAAFFRNFGKFIGCYPIPCLIAFAIVMSLTVFAFPMNLRDRVRDGYTPTDSRAYAESRALRQFSRLNGDPMMTTVILRARDRSSMIDEDNLMQAVELFQHIKQTLSVPLNQLDPDGPGKKYTDFCGNHCRQNDVVDYFALELAKHRRGQGNSIFGTSNLTYPLATLMGQEVHLERNFYGVNTSYVADRNYTNIDYCELIVLAFTADIQSPEEEELVARWEVAVFDYAQKRSKDEKIEMLVIGAEIVDLEMNKDSQRMTPYFVIGFLGAVVFIFLSAWCSLFLYSRLSPEHSGWKSVIANLCLPILVCVVPACAIMTTFGIYGLFGMRINSLMLIMPFLIMGIGVNDSFLVVHHWLREDTSLSRRELMGRVFKDVGPSITMTTLTNVISFAVGSVSPTEEIALFCLGSAIAMGFAYMFTWLFFGAMLCFFTSIEGVPAHKPGRIQKKALGFFDKLLAFYARLLQTWWFRVFWFLAWTGFLIGGIVGTTQITSKLETEKILPKETPIHLPNRIIENTVWPAYYPVIVMVHRPFDVADVALRTEFMKMVDELEAIKGCRGSKSTILWLRDYEKYFDFVADGANVDFWETSDEDEEKAVITKGQYDNSQLAGFLGSPLTKHFKGMMQVDDTMSVPIRKFSFVVAYRNHTTWDDRIRLQEEWREIVDRYPNLNTTIWNVNGMFVDQMQSLKGVAKQSIIWTLVCMGIVCVCFIQKIVAVAVATLSIGSIAIGTIGYLGIWELDLDPVTICAILISIGMSVDFTAHISMYFVNCPRHSDGLPPSAFDRLIHSIGSIFWPAIQGNASTLICVLPLVALNNYIPLVFVKTLTLVVIIGTAHGLLLIPMLLSVLPQSILEWDLLSRRGSGMNSSQPSLANCTTVEGKISIDGKIRDQEGQEMLVLPKKAERVVLLNQEYGSDQIL